MYIRNNHRYFIKINIISDQEMTNKYECLLEGIKGKDAEISTLRYKS